MSDDTKRLILALLLSGAVMLGYGIFFGPGKTQQPPAGQPAQTTQQAAPKAPAKTPAAKVKPATPTVNPAAGPVAKAKPARRAARSVAPEVVVENQVAKMFFSAKGGALRRVELKKYYKHPGKKGGNYILLDLDPAGPLSLSLDLPKADPELSDKLFTPSRTGKLEVKPGGENQLSFSHEDGILKVVRTYRFKPDTYTFELTVSVTNQGQAPVEFHPELSMAEKPHKEEANRYAFTGAELMLDGSLEELDTGDLKDNPVKAGAIRWVTLSIPYFMGAVIPLPDDPTIKRSVRGGATDQLMGVTLVDPRMRLEPGQQKSFRYQIFYGPRELNLLESVGHDLAKAVDFGWFDIIAKPLLALLNFLYGFVGNYGVAIIIVTILTKIIFFPLAQKSYKSMKQMQKLQPQITKIREKYKHDKQRMNQEIMQLYKTYKVNPMGGCLPMLVQIPVFIAFYKVLGASIELRHAPFMLWINDLSAPDRLWPDLGLPYVGGIPVLTLLMGVSMFIQQKMTPTMGDPTQAKMMLLMPIVFTVMFINFPSGLVLYWLVQNILGIAQQYWTNKRKA